MLVEMWFKCGRVHDYETTNGRKDAKDTTHGCSFRDAFFSHFRDYSFPLEIDKTPQSIGTAGPASHPPVGRTQGSVFM